jgi:phosphatidylserine/phosphatidylglycerophosphate/cardiolipin synthase-like enzyme
MTYLQRRIFKTALTGTETTRELLQTMFVGEILNQVQIDQAHKIWIVSPWVSNIMIIDNRSGNFDCLNPEWGRREIRLGDLLISLMTRGIEVFVVTRDVEQNKGFLSSFKGLVEEHALGDQHKVILRDQLHTKGILLSKSQLLGSMNLTHYGLEINDESIIFSTDVEDVAQTRLEFERYLS